MRPPDRAEASSRPSHSHPGSAALRAALLGLGWWLATRRPPLKLSASSVYVRPVRAQWMCTLLLPKLSSESEPSPSIHLYNALYPFDPCLGDG
jgi:hypothetical protein